MELKINIPKNDYKVPVEVRPEVVEGICKYLLDGNKIYTYDKDNNQLYLIKSKLGNRWFYEVTSTEQGCPNAYELCVRIHGVEMNAAFEALLMAGYHLYGTYNITSGSHMYVCSRTPYYKGQLCSCTGFKLFID